MLSRTQGISFATWYAFFTRASLNRFWSSVSLVSPLLRDSSFRIGGLFWAASTATEKKSITKATTKIQRSACSRSLSPPFSTFILQAPVITCCMPFAYRLPFCGLNALKNLYDRRFEVCAGLFTNYPALLLRNSRQYGTDDRTSARRRRRPLRRAGRPKGSPLP